MVQTKPIKPLQKVANPAYCSMLLFLPSKDSSLTLLAYIHTDRACRTSDILQVSTTSHQIASTTEHSRRYQYLPIATPKKEVSYGHHLSIPSNSLVAETSYSLKSELGSTFRRLDDPAQEPGKDL